MGKRSAVPFREWTWNEREGYREGVHTGDGRLTWFSWFATPHAGGGGADQDFESFLKKGPSVPGVPGSVVTELTRFLAEHLDGADGMLEGGLNRDAVILPDGPPVESFSLYRGYDAEYEFTVDFFPNCIHWHLEFDEQWSDPDRDAVQSLADFLEHGPPSDFSLLEGEDGFRELALKLMGRTQ